MGKIWAVFRSVFDDYTLTLIGVVILATVFPVYGIGVGIASVATKLVVALLFFLHGLMLSPQCLWAGRNHWRLHLSILTATFIMFPILGVLMKPLLIPLVGESLYIGLLFVCVLPSTVQTSIAFTSIAGGNVAAAVCAASASSLLGVFITPLLVGLLMNTVSGGFSGQAIIDLCLQLLLPFAVGQLLRGRLAGFVSSHKSLVGYVDRLSVLFIIYVSFSGGATSGLWETVSLGLLLALGLACAVLLAVALFLTDRGGRLLGFNRADRITLLFCGSKKSLASGVPMANVIFPAAVASTLILPLMIFHQIQLMVCAWMARRMGLQLSSEEADDGYR